VTDLQSEPGIPPVTESSVVIESPVEPGASTVPPLVPDPEERSIPAHGGQDHGTVWLHLSVVGGFVALGVMLWWHVWITGSPTATISCQCGDPSQELWFLTWTPWALIHGHTPFLTNAIYAGQGGANMMTNTSWMVPAVILAPITWLFGPIASFNVAAVLAPAISGWCFFLAARKVTTLVPAQVLGGLLFGFSPFVLWNDPFGHINFTLLFFPPLAFILLYDLFVTHRRSAVRIGVLMALLVIAEFFTSTELLAMGILIIALTLIAAAALAPRSAWSQRRRFLTALGVTGAIALVVLAYPLWFALDGPRRIIGVPWANAPRWGTSPSALIDAGVRVHQSSYFNIIGGYYGGAGPNAGPLHLPSLIYFGIPLLAFVAVSVITWYRWRLAWTLVIGSAIAWMLSFGTTFGDQVGGATTTAGRWWLPWHAFAHLPLVSDILPIRFGLFVTFGVAMLLAISLDRWGALVVTALERRGEPGGGTTWYRRRRLVVGSLMTVLGVAVLIPVALTNSLPFTVEPSPMPAWFTVDAPRLPTGTIVLVVPFEGQRAMGWQAQTGLHFDLAGGFAVVPGPDGRSAFVSTPTGAIATLDRLSSDPESIVTTPLPSSHREVETVRSVLTRWNVGVTVVTREGRQPEYSAAFFTAVYGRAPAYRHGVWVWTGPPGTTIVPVSSSRLSKCTASAPASDPLAAPRCMLDPAAMSAAASPVAQPPTVSS
jgi:hypothetical protein